MDQDLVTGLIRDVERSKGRIDTHERECALRYKHIEDNTKAMAESMKAIGQDVSALRRQGEHAAWSANWKAWGVAAFVGSLLIAALSWSLSQLYTMRAYVSPAAVQVKH